jgi:hypothetical protein
MGLRRTILIAGLLLVPTALQSVGSPRVMPRLESDRGNFFAFAEGVDLRRRLIREAEACWQTWQQFFGKNATAPSPAILIVDRAAYPRPGGVGSCSTGVAEADAGLWKIQIDLYTRDAFGDGSLLMEIFRAVALRHMHSSDPPRAGQAVRQPPRWILEALAEEVRRKADGIPRGLVEKLMPEGQPPDLAAFLAVKPERSGLGNAVLYRAQALALLEVLRADKAGLERLLQRGAEPLNAESLVQLFPGLGGIPGLSRRWTLALVKNASPSGLASLDLAETNARLTEILGGEGEPLAELLTEKARSPGGAYAMRLAAGAILQLELPAHPILRPLLADYRAILDVLSRRPKNDMRERILANEVLRLESLALGESAAELLDWAEIELQPPARPLVLPPEFEPARREDPYARVLDRIEAVGR